MQTPSDYFVTKARSIPRLIHTNFAVWSNAIKYVLIGTNTWDIVTGVGDVPQDGDVEYKEYYKRSNKAVSILYGSITPAIQAYVAGVVDPAEMCQLFAKRWTSYKTSLVQLSCGTNSTMKFSTHRIPLTSILAEYFLIRIA